jgi:hypothetical protein
MKNTLELKFGCSFVGLGLTRKGHDVVTLSNDVLLIVSPPKSEDIARRFIAQIVVHPCATLEDAKAGSTFSSPNTVADLPAYTFSFVSDDNGNVTACVRRALAELLLFGPSDSMTLYIVD